MSPRTPASAWPTCSTHVYANIDGLDLLVDVYLPETRAAPVLLYLHGGGFVCGDKTSHPLRQLQYLLSRGYCVVSPNYPLAPQSTVFSQVDAVVQAWNWIHSPRGMRSALAQKGAHKTTKHICYPEVGQTAVWGSSAAASLLLFSLQKLAPPPACMVLPYPFVDLLRPGKAGNLRDLGAGNFPSLDAKQCTEILSLAHCGEPKQESPFGDLIRMASGQEPISLSSLDPNTLFLYASTSLGLPYFSGVLGGIDVLRPSATEREMLAEVDVFRIAREVVLPPLLVLQGRNDSLTPPANTKEFLAQAHHAQIARARTGSTKTRIEPGLVPAPMELIETSARGGRHVFDFLFAPVPDMSTAEEDKEWDETIGAAVNFLDVWCRPGTPRSPRNGGSPTIHRQNRVEGTARSTAGNGSVPMSSKQTGRAPASPAKCQPAAPKTPIPCVPSSPRACSHARASSRGETCRE